MTQIILEVHFNEDIAMTPEEAQTEVTGAIERQDLGLTLVEEGGYPIAYDVQDNQVDVLVDVESDDSIQAARLALKKVLANGSGAPVHEILGQRRKN